MATGKPKSIDNIKNILEMAKTMEALGISCEGLETLSEMKASVRDKLRQAEKTPSWTAGQAFSILSEAKEEDARKRQLLLDFYTKLDSFLGKMDEQMLTLLQKHAGNLEQNMKQHITQLERKEYFLLVAGETSSGKSSLVNLILGEEVLPYSLLSTTSTICELKFGEERKIVAHFKDKDLETGQPTKTILLGEPTGSAEQSYLEQISPYVHLKTEREKGSLFKKIELFWPHSLLQKGIVIIDSPGVGESDEMDEMVTQYLPEAFAFIYVINSANAGGVQKDRLQKLLQKAWEVSLGMQEEEEKEENKIPFGEQESLLSKCALFVCNKWDQVPDKEIKTVQNDVTTKLERVWPGLHPESQIIYMSTMNANKAQNYGLITEDFSSLMDGMRTVVLKSIEARLEIHWGWLENLLSRVIFQAKAFVINASRDSDKVKQKMTRIVRRLDAIEKQQDRVISDLHKHLDERVNFVVQQLAEYLLSEEVKTRFTSWTMDEVPSAESSWEETDQKITVALSNRFRGIIEQWEEDNKVSASARVSLMQNFQKVYDDVEGQLLNLQNAVTDDHDNLYIPELNRSRFRLPRFIDSGYVDPLLWVGALILLPVAIYFTLRERREARIRYKDNKCAFMAQESADYLAAFATEKNLKELVQDRFKAAKFYLQQIESRLPDMIQADKMLYEQLIDETRSNEEIQRFYQPILDEGSQHRGQLALLGITEVCAVKISREELEWKEDMSSYLGSGAFGVVYQGKMTRHGVVQSVALKVCHEVLDAGNACDIMEEMKLLRMLDHPHIVQFYGISFHETMDAVRMILILEKCKGNLKSHIFRNPESVPGKSEDPAVVGEACRWVKEITGALAYIHDLGVVHRDLKLENVLLSEENSVRIADVGLSKPAADITGTLVGTPAYIAPEVFHTKTVYDNKADIYSLGIMMWEMWYGQQAFADVPGETLQDLFSWVDAGNRPVDRKSCNAPPSLWEQLMTQCWEGNPEKRPTARTCNNEIAKLLQEFVQDLHQPTNDEGSQHSGQPAELGITEVCAVQVSREELDWKEDASSYLGSGAFGVVYQGKMSKDGEVRGVALKIYSEVLDVGNAGNITEKMNILRTLDHPHIVQFYGVSLLEDKDAVRVILVMEKCKENLKSHIFGHPESVPGKSENPAVVGEACRWVKEITDALAYIHELRVVHRGLKLENILLSKENSVKIADVGLSKPRVDLTDTIVGTAVYMAPEVFHSQEYDSKADIYSLGIIMWEMWHGQQAFADDPVETQKELFSWVDVGNRPVDRKGCRKPYFLWEHLMAQCWKGEPEKRPTAERCNRAISMLHVELATLNRSAFE